MATGLAPRVISTIPYGGEKQAVKELLRFCEWSPAAIAAALYRNPPQIAKSLPPLALLYPPPPKPQEGPGGGHSLENYRHYKGR